MGHKPTFCFFIILFFIIIIEQSNYKILLKKKHSNQHILQSGHAFTVDLVKIFLTYSLITTQNLVVVCDTVHGPCTGP